MAWCRPLCALARGSLSVPPLPRTIARPRGPSVPIALTYAHAPTHAFPITQVGTASRMVVLGGRSQHITSELPPDWIQGGVVGDVPAGFQRYRPQLMNDVWYSDNALDWKIATPGCFVPHSLFVPATGKAYQQCTSDVHCRTGLRLGTARSVRCERGRCVCNVWTQRERHTVSVHRNAIYLMGGVTTVTKQMCATLECGGGYQVQMAAMGGEEAGTGAGALNQLCPVRGTTAACGRRRTSPRAERLRQSKLLLPDPWLGCVPTSLCACLCAPMNRCS
jgi:hypothetical protein